jgi:hypothetical protein
MHTISFINVPSPRLFYDDNDNNIKIACNSKNKKSEKSYRRLFNF